MTTDVLAAFIPDLERWEGKYGWMYRDKYGYATIGIGNLVHYVDDAIKLPFRVDGGRMATEGEIRAEFARVMAIAPNLKASAYRKAGTQRVELSDDEVTVMAIARLSKDFIPGILRLMPAFETFPPGPQRAIVDISWNVGIGRPAAGDQKATGLNGFPHMVACCNARDWQAAAAQSKRPEARDERNQWTHGAFLSAVGV